MPRHAALVATGRHVPPVEVPNDALRARFDAAVPGFVDKMEEATGILTRFYAPDGEATSDLAARAAEQALARAGVPPADVDLVLVGTDSPDYITPATSVVVQAKLGAVNAGTFDIGCACASFPTGLATAAGLIATNASLRNVVVVGAYLMHRLADPKDPTVFFYGDGAGAAVLQPSAEPGVLGAAFLADGTYAKHWGIYAGGTAEPATPEAIAAGRTCVRLLERYPPEVNLEGWPRLVRRLAAEQDFALDAIDVAIFTQVRRQTILDVAADLGIDPARCPMIMDRWGYTGSACLAMALDDAVLRGQVRPGHLVTLVGSGVGYNQAAVALRVTDALRTGRG